MYPISARFEWDPRKADANWIKHRIRFEEAATAFDDPDRLELFDREHSTRVETREILIGRSEKERLLFISFTQRPNRIRIISARHATGKERTFYESETS